MLDRSIHFSPPSCPHSAPAAAAAATLDGLFGHDITTAVKSVMTFFPSKGMRLTAGHVSDDSPA